MSFAKNNFKKVLKSFSLFLGTLTMNDPTLKEGIGGKRRPKNKVKT
jgi:hypothetical protein